MPLLACRSARAAPAAAPAAAPWCTAQLLFFCGRGGAGGATMDDSLLHPWTTLSGTHMTQHIAHSPRPCHQCGVTMTTSDVGKRENWGTQPLCFGVGLSRKKERKDGTPRCARPRSNPGCLDDVSAVRCTPRSAAVGTGGAITCSRLAPKQRLLFRCRFCLVRLAWCC